MSPDVKKCENCEERAEDGMNFCKICISKHIRVCTCDKEFITGKPTILNILDTQIPVPERIPDYFMTQLNGNIYHILACRGCKYLNEEISIQDNFTRALQASIVSCVYQLDLEYEYISDSLDEVFEKYIAEKGIVVGNPMGIEVKEGVEVGQSIEISDV